MKNNKYVRDEDRLKIMSDVADMYYNKGMREKEIGGVIDRSAMQVSRLLKEARENRIVEFIIHKQNTDELRQHIMETFTHLSEVRITPYSSRYPAMRKVLAKEAAAYFDEIITENTGVGISGGKTIHEMIEALTSRPRKIRVYPLVGIWRDPQIHYVDSSVLTHLLWYKSIDVAEAYWLPLQPLDAGATKQTALAQRESLLKNPKMRAVYDAACNVDIAFVGVGIFKKTSSTLGHLKKIGITYDDLQKRGAIGIVGGVWYDSKAKPIIDDYFLSVPLSRLHPTKKRPNKKTVIVAAGEDKLEAIRVLIKHKICNVLITDSRTAGRLTEK